MVCAACEAWMKPRVDKQAQTVCCSECGHVAPHRFLPVFIVTGPSGVGKTAVVPELQHQLPNWHTFETDILWDSAGSWDTAHCNWLRIASAMAQHPNSMPTLLCGTMLPENVARCDSYGLFSTVHWLALCCEPEEHARRLRARPTWRGWTEAKIAEHLAFARWFDDHASSAFEPPLALFDTTNTTVVETASEIAAWALKRMKDEG